MELTGRLKEMRKWEAGRLEGSRAERLKRLKG
jgi:hypothetical protein